MKYISDLQTMIFFNILIAIPVFFFCKWALKKIKPERTKNISTLVGTIILTPIIYLTLVFVFFSILFYEPINDFDNSKWLKDKTKRYQMSDRIIQSKILIGKDKIQLKRILGNPLEQNDSINRWTYDMGEGGGGLGFMFHYLIVNFNDNKVVSAIHVKAKD